MPYYDYRCLDCKRRVSIYSARFVSAEEMSPACPHCGGTNLRRLIGRVGILRSEESRTEDLADPSALAGLDESDPKSLGRFMRKMSHETGEDLGPEFDEVVGRLEAGEKPEDIEKTMPDLGGPGTAGPGDDDFSM